MTKNVLDHLYLVSNEILGPVMQNPDNQQGWTDLVTKDLMERFNAYVAQVYVMIGLNKGRTMLPLPNRKLINSDGSEKDKAHIFEGSIITWTKQIKNVLKLEPEQALKAGNPPNPGPMTELKFWENKAANLNSIYEQLQSVDVKTILRFL
jgi:dynein heavy chain